MNRRTRHGNLAIFFCVVLAAVMLLFGTLLPAASLRAAENDLNRAMSAQIRTSLAAYDHDFRQFGLWGFAADAVDNSVFTGTLPAKLHGLAVKTEPLMPLLAQPVLDGQITRYMKGRLPAVYLDMLASRLTSCHNSIAGQSGGKLPVNVDSLTANIVAEDVRGAANSLFGDVLVKMQDKLLALIEANYRQYAAEILGAESDTAISGLLGQTPDFLDPQAISRLAGQLDRILEFNTGPIYEKCCLTEYILGQFRPSVEKMLTSAGLREMQTIDGRLFKDFPNSRQSEVEQILTGLNKPDSANLAIRVALTGLRSVIHLIAILTDEQQLSALRTAAIAMSAAIVVISSGMVTIEPNIMLYLLATGQAIGDGLADYENLLSGKAVNIWPGRAEINIGLYYQDYLRFFLLIVPQPVLIERIGRLLGQILPRTCYTSLRVTTGFRGRTYSLSDGYR